MHIASEFEINTYKISKYPSDGGKERFVAHLRPIGRSYVEIFTIFEYTQEDFDSLLDRPKDLWLYIIGRGSHEQESYFELVDEVEVLKINGEEIDLEEYFR